MTPEQEEALARYKEMRQVALAMQASSDDEEDLQPSTRRGGGTGGSGSQRSLAHVVDHHQDETRPDDWLGSPTNAAARRSWKIKSPPSASKSKVSPKLSPKLQHELDVSLGSLGGGGGNSSHHTPISAGKAFQSARAAFEQGSKTPPAAFSHRTTSYKKTTARSPPRGPPLTTTSAHRRASAAAPQVVPQRQEDYQSLLQHWIARLKKRPDPEVRLQSKRNSLLTTYPKHSASAELDEAELEIFKVMHQLKHVQQQQRQHQRGKMEPPPRTTSDIYNQWAQDSASAVGQDDKKKLKKIIQRLEDESSNSNELQAVLSSLRSVAKAKQWSPDTTNILQDALDRLKSIHGNTSTVDDLQELVEELQSRDFASLTNLIRQGSEQDVQDLVHLLSTSQEQLLQDETTPKDSRTRATDSAHHHHHQEMLMTALAKLKRIPYTPKQAEAVATFVVQLRTTPPRQQKDFTSTPNWGSLKKVFRPDPQHLQAVEDAVSEMVQVTSEKDDDEEENDMVEALVEELADDLRQACVVDDDEEEFATHQEEEEAVVVEPQKTPNLVDFEYADNDKNRPQMILNLPKTSAHGGHNNDDDDDISEVDLDEALTKTPPTVAKKSVAAKLTPTIQGDRKFHHSFQKSESQEEDEEEEGQEEEDEEDEDEKKIVFRQRHHWKHKKHNNTILGDRRYRMADHFGADEVIYSPLTREQYGRRKKIGAAIFKNLGDNDSIEDMTLEEMEEEKFDKEDQITKMTRSAPQLRYNHKQSGGSAK